MKRDLYLPLSTFAALSLLAAMPARAQEAAGSDPIPYTRTIRVEPSDNEAMIVEKAAHVVPSANQLAALDRGFIAFVHFGPNTFTRREWGTGSEDPALFALKNLDTDQWCAAMKAAGMKMVILTVKHHDGFVMWQSRYTRHGIMSSPFMGGKGDVAKSLSQSCQKYGLKFGIYLSPADLYQMESATGLYGNESQYTLRTIPRAVEGRPFANKKSFQFKVDDYNEYFLNQLFELLTEYGPISEVWFDGAHPKHKGNQQYNYRAWKELIHTLAPQAAVFGREDIRWCGNEGGSTRSTEWNVIPYQANPDTMNVFMDRTDTDLGSNEALYKWEKPFFLHYQPGEIDTSIRNGWFYRDDSAQQVRSADDVFDIYERSAGGNAILLLNVPANREGRLSPRDVECLQEVGRRIKATYGTNLLQGSNAPVALMDSDLNSYIEMTPQSELVITTPQPVTLNRLCLQESIALRGERVSRFAVDAMIDGAWKEIATATNIGFRRTLRFNAVTTSQWRIRLIDCRATAALASVSGHYYKERPPMLVAHRDAAGMVTLWQKGSDFQWNGTDTRGLSPIDARYKVYYTTDGTMPTPNSYLYTGPFKLTNRTLNAISYRGDEEGAVCTETYGLSHEGWQVTAGSSDDAHAASASIDADSRTYWSSREGSSDQSLTIDLGAIHRLTGICYTPQVENGNGMVEKGCIYVSKDGKKWKKQAIFDFGNLINDPTPRTFNFVLPVKSRWVKIEPLVIAGGGSHASVAELDFFADEEGY